MPIITINNPSPLIPSVPSLEGNSVTFPAWRSRLKDVLAIQGVHDIVTGKLVQPDGNTKPSAKSSEQHGYNPEESAADWDALSEVALSTIKLTLSVDLSIR